MKSDTDFLKDNKLSQWFNFSDKNDPFLVIPSCAHSGVGLKGLKKVRSKKQQKDKTNISENKYEVPLDNSLMQRIKASEVVLEKETKDIESEVSESPATTNSKTSPSKNLPINHETETENENVNPNPNSHHMEDVKHRESLFDLRKKNHKDSNGNSNEGIPKKVSPKATPAVINHTEPTPIEEAEIEDDETFEYDIVPLGITEKEAVSFLENYIKKVDVKLGASFSSPQRLFESSMKGNNTKWFGLKNKGSSKDIDGVFIYSLDSHFDRINILHLSTINRKGLGAAIEKSSNYMWANESANECRLGLYHYEEDKNGKPTKVVDTELRDLLKGAKFRWKNVLNEANDRILVMGGVRPNSENDVKNELENMFEINSALLYSVSNLEVRPQSATSNGSIFFMPSLYLGSLMKVFSHETEDDMRPPHHQCLFDILDSIRNDDIEAFPLTTSNKDKDVVKAIEPAINNEIKLDLEKIKTSQSEYHCNAVKVDGKLISIDYYIHSIKANKYLYLRVKAKEII
jgi:hypothetical protein